MPTSAFKTGKIFLQMLGQIVEIFIILHTVHDCRDVKDNQILEIESKRAGRNATQKTLASLHRVKYTTK